MFASLESSPVFVLVRIETDERRRQRQCLLDCKHPRVPIFGVIFVLVLVDLYDDKVCAAVNNDIWPVHRASFVTRARAYAGIYQKIVDSVLLDAFVGFYNKRAFGTYMVSCC